MRIEAIDMGVPEIGSSGRSITDYDHLFALFSEQIVVCLIFVADMIHAMTMYDHGTVKHSLVEFNGVEVLHNVIS